MNSMHTSRHFWIASGILILTLSISSLAELRGSQELTASLASIPSTIAGWSATQEIDLDPRTLERLRASSLVSREYAKGDDRLGLFVAYYAHQSSSGYMHSPKICLPGSGWEIEEPGLAQVQTSRGPVAVNRYVISNSGQKALILYWYQSTNRITADEYVTKLYMIHDGLFYGRAGGSIARIQLPLDPTAEAGGLKFAGELMTALRDVLGT